MTAQTYQYYDANGGYSDSGPSTSGSVEATEFSGSFSCMGDEISRTGWTFEPQHHLSVPIDSRPIFDELNTQIYPYFDTNASYNDHSCPTTGGIQAMEPSDSLGCMGNEHTRNSKPQCSGDSMVLRDFYSGIIKPTGPEPIQDCASVDDFQFVSGCRPIVSSTTSKASDK